MLLYSYEITIKMCFASLKVNFPIVVTQLGVFDSNSDGLRGSLTARLYDRISQVSELSVTLVVGRQVR